MRRIYFFFLTVLLISCSSNSYEVTGVTQGFDDGTAVVFYELNAQNQAEVIDTAFISQNRFAIQFPQKDTPTINYITIAGVRANILYFPENENLTVQIDKDDIQNAAVSGSKLNDAYTQYVRTLRDFAEQKEAQIKAYQKAQREQDAIGVQNIQAENQELILEEKRYKEQFVRENNNSLFAIILLSDMVNKKEVTFDTSKEILESFTPKIASTPLYKELETQIAQMKNAEIGSLAPDFSAPTPEGNSLSLKEAMGTYTIIDFWASWCRPCRIENPNVVRVYKKYHDKGLNIISVSLDKAGQRERWLQAIEKDEMDWYHVSNLQFWQDPIARMYNVRAIPATFLLDADGKIIAKNLRGQALENKIASLLGS